MAEPYVIIGNGVAGVNAAEAIREREPEAPVILLTDQECEFYSRPSLYYVLLGRIRFDDAAGRPRDFYRRNRFGLRCGTTVSEIDPEAHTVTLGDGESLRYRRLLLAMGTRGRTLPWLREGVKGVVELNTLRDVVEITHAVGGAESAAVVGGGLTSIEIVEALAHHGIRTTFIMRDDRFLAKQLTAEEAEPIHQRMREHGVEMRTGEEIAEMLAEGDRTTGVVTKGGDTIPCQIVGAAVGIVPNRELAEAAGAEVVQGIVVDDRMATTLPDVFAAGDVAQVRRPDGRAARSEMLWYVAARMGRTAGANMAGGDEPYRAAPFLNVAELFGVDLCGVGSILPEQEGVETLWAPDASRGTARAVLREGAIIGGCFVGDIRLGDITRALIARGTRWDELSPDHPLRARFAQ
jgi:NAD(P)H-nitrite reductase large subunit